MKDKLFTRIEKLFDVGTLSEASVLVAGCGSGGGMVALQLAMSGITEFTLIDHDVLEPENVIRHVCGLRYVGQKKVDALSDVLLDRNPALKIEKHNKDIFELTDFNKLVDASTVVILATDNEASRYRVNDACVETRTPFVVGRVFTRGTGGEVFAYRPSRGGCLACLESVLERTEYRDGVREIDLISEEEREKMYGMNITEIKDSPGLIVDISFITAFHTRFALDSIAATLSARPKYLSAMKENYLVWGNRPEHPFKKHFQLQRITLTPQELCKICGEVE
ncbi:MAG: ThiF family adenylyltransferase [Candidatus Dadabacteria bacterium]|nr:ThiF family adenylyltransferase [Candidatus Dadabacteria bacterium]MYI73715.1 ThiF family adenylyltransferase [Candidatus Dadabacteria bacterium]